jgi:uncharacterized membrane protein YfcA
VYGARCEGGNDNVKGDDRPMTPLEFVLICFGASIGAGFLGSLLGLGGGLIVIPTLTLALKVDIRYAIGASIVSIIATSSGAAAAYVRERMTNLRVAMVLEVATTLGALTGGYLAGRIAGHWLFVVFGVVMAGSAAMMLRKRRNAASDAGEGTPWANYLRLNGSYYDAALDKEVPYRVVRARLGLALMYVAGMMSGLLGIGSGVLKVPAMDLGMRLPIKVSTATSNFMIGVTAAASAGLYFARGDINPFIAGPVAAGILVGAMIGARVMGRLRSSVIRYVFVAVLLFVSAQMLLKGLKGPS